jgi:hypothetical protein
MKQFMPWMLPVFRIILKVVVIVLKIINKFLVAVNRIKPELIYFKLLNYDYL